jgi:hypothetical protein
MPDSRSSVLLTPVRKQKRQQAIRPTGSMWCHFGRDAAHEKAPPLMTYGLLFRRHRRH